MIGTKKTYFLDPSYVVRLDNLFFDDTPYTDEFQSGVYELAYNIAVQRKLRRVLDIGCGSGYKLLHWFEKEFVVAGVEVQPTLKWLRNRYPDNMWGDATMLKDTSISSDMVICSDVIEHLPRPDELLDTIAACKPKVIVISTPALEHLEQGCIEGPPRNVHHVREWQTDQFKAYLGSRFTVIEHVVTEQKNQIVVCTP